MRGLPSGQMKLAQLGRQSKNTLVIWDLTISPSILTVVRAMVSVTTTPADAEFLAGQSVTVGAQLVIVWTEVVKTVKVVETPESVDEELRPRRWWKC